MTSSFKQPPGFNPNGGDSYADWKNDIEIWKLFTKEDTKRQGPAVYLTLHERLVRATAKLEFDDIKEKLQRVFGEFGDTLAADGTQEGSMPVKTEESLYTYNYFFGLAAGDRPIS